MPLLKKYVVIALESDLVSANIFKLPFLFNKYFVQYFGKAFFHRYLLPYLTSSYMGVVPLIIGIRNKHICKVSLYSVRGLVLALSKAIFLG